MTGLWVAWHPTDGMSCVSGSFAGPAPTEEEVPKREAKPRYVPECWQLVFLGDDGRIWPIRSMPSMKAGR